MEAICINVAKAFDCINLLLYKMYKIGFDDRSLTWFRSYLTWTQQVNFEKIISPKVPVKTGIGQGTILGPLFFIFYINNKVSVINNLKINMYADDSFLYISVNNWSRMILKYSRIWIIYRNGVHQTEGSSGIILLKNVFVSIYKQTLLPIRDFPDHATFRENSA